MTETYRLPNGLTVVLERLGHLRSAAVGVFLRAGSMLETPEENGLSHLAEHMAFKGTDRRSARELAELTDAIGGHVNAATGKLYTAYYARVTDSDLPLALDLLSDLVIRPKHPLEELEKEKNVVLEELGMAEDSPEEVAEDLIHEAVYAGQSLAMTVLGRRENILSFSRDSLERFREKYYTPANAVLAVAGRFDRQAIRDAVEDLFGAWAGELRQQYPAQVPNRAPMSLYRNKAGEQVHCFSGYAGISSEHPDLHALGALSTVLGGGVSSRLFQRIREEQGLVYSIYTSPSFYPGCGDFLIYAAASPRSVRRVLGLIEKETEKLIREGVSEKELEQTKSQLKTGFVLSQESAYRRMTDLGLGMLLRGRVTPPATTLKKIAAITADDIRRLASAVLRQPASHAFVGSRADRCLGAIPGRGKGGTHGPA